ncbi:MarR family transcriptional regulator [Natrarchaeobius oligotrophus]|uniref:MarR family transcriptional regulator n=2 Tax=Natrarchaeobius TaxID=2501796 RepID=A0A3N6PPA7_NATCH|nr:MarR family transcriptional regulator [Natrarchaeobius chitinivorans]
MSTTEQSIAVPDDLESPQAKLVYLTLLVTDEATVTDLQQLLGLSKLTLLPILTSLTSKNLVRRTDAGYASH